MLLNPASLSVSAPMHDLRPSLREQTQDAVHASWTAAAWKAFCAELAQALRPTPFVLGALAGLFLAFVGPFGSDTASMVQRLFYWPVVILGGTLIGILVSSAFDALFDREQKRPILSTVLTAIFLTPLGSIFVLGATRAFFGATTMGYWTLLGPVFLLSLAMTGLNHLAERRRSPQFSAVSVEAPPVQVRLRERLPFRLKGAQIHAVEAEDHYLRVHTAEGSDLILLRLSDAIAELEGIEGAQTHRSWWVARDAVRDVRRADGRATLVLAQGVEAPVSRSYVPELRNKGWF